MTLHNLAEAFDVMARYAVDAGSMQSEYRASLEAAKAAHEGGDVLAAQQALIRAWPMVGGHNGSTDLFVYAIREVNNVWAERRMWAMTDGIEATTHKSYQQPDPSDFRFTTGI